MHETGLPLIAITSIRMDILRERIEGFDFLGEIGINEEEEGYKAFLTINPEINRPWDSIIKNLKEFHGISFIDGCHILNNSIELSITFLEHQKEAFLHFISELFKVLYPSLKPTDIAAQLSYNNFISKPSVDLKYLFLSDGSGPSETELKYGRLLIDNFEIEPDEDEYFEEETE